MFKCCVCKRAPKNVKTELKLDDMSIGSPKFTAYLTKDETSILPTADTPNGDVQRAEENASTAPSDSTPIRANSTTDVSREQQGGNVEEKSNSGSTGQETVEEPEKPPVVNDKDKNKDDRPDGSADDAVENVIPPDAAVNDVKPNLYDASGYIERTIDDGPEDEGDDSVFEACPNENDTAKKPSPTGTGIRR